MNLRSGWFTLVTSETFLVSKDVDGFNRQRPGEACVPLVKSQARRVTDMAACLELDPPRPSQVMHSKASLVVQLNEV